MWTLWLASRYKEEALPPSSLKKLIISVLLSITYVSLENWTKYEVFYHPLYGHVYDHGGCGAYQRA